MTRLRRLKQRAQRAGVYLLPAYNEVTKTFDTASKKFDIFVASESILGPRGLSMTKRQAIQFASSIASKPAGKVRFSFA